jgi:putative ATPase
LRNAATALLETLGYGEGYRYPHEGAEGYVPGVQYLPDVVADARFYEPSDIGAEAEIKARQEKRTQRAT